MSFTATEVKLLSARLVTSLHFYAFGKKLVPTAVRYRVLPSNYNLDRYDDDAIALVGPGLRLFYCNKHHSSQSASLLAPGTNHEENCGHNWNEWRRTGAARSSL